LRAAGNEGNTRAAAGEKPHKSEPQTGCPAGDGHAKILQMDIV
jgi:hypothetical protein